MAYTTELHGYAQKDERIASAMAFCDTLGGDEYNETRHYIDCTGVIPDWLAEKMRVASGAEKPWHKYIVTHCGKDTAVVAKSEAAAINQLRFNLYGTRPLDSLPPFSARLADERTVENIIRRADGTARTCKLTKADIRERLHRMAS